MRGSGTGRRQHLDTYCRRGWQAAQSSAVMMYEKERCEASDRSLPRPRRLPIVGPRPSFHAL